MRMIRLGRRDLNWVVVILLELEGRLPPKDLALVFRTVEELRSEARA